MTRLYSIALLISLILSACAAAPAAAPIGTQETLQGMKAAYQGQPGSFVMQLKDLYIMAWPRGSSYGFTLVCPNGCDPNAVRLNTNSMAELVKSLESVGWKFIAPTALPATIQNVLGTTSMNSAMSAFSRLGSMMMVLPVTSSNLSFPTQEVIQQ